MEFRIWRRTQRTVDIQMTKKGLFELAHEAGYSEEEFRQELSNVYCAMSDMDLDEDPEGTIEEEMLFSGHKLIVRIHREFLN